MFILACSIKKKKIGCHFSWNLLLRLNIVKYWKRDYNGINHWLKFHRIFRKVCTTSTTRGVSGYFSGRGGFRGTTPLNTPLYNPFNLPRSSRRPLQHSWGLPSRPGRGCPPRSPCMWTCTPGRRRHNPPLQLITFSNLNKKTDFIIFIVFQPDGGNIYKYRTYGCKDIDIRKPSFCNNLWVSNPEIFATPCLIP